MGSKQTKNRRKVEVFNEWDKVQEAVQPGPCRPPNRPDKPLTERHRKYLDAIESHPVVVCVGPAGTGKAQPLDSDVVTPSGIRKMGDIVAGDLVCCPDGSATSVLAVFPQGIKPVYRITFTDGSSAECCLDHLWEVGSKQREWKNHKVVDTNYIIKNVKSKAGKRQLYVPVTDAVAMNYRPVPTDPYLVGVLIGDGGLTSLTPKLTSADDFILSQVSAALPEGTTLRKSGKSKYDYAIRKKTRNSHVTNPMTESLREIGLMGKYSYEKSIPDDYLFTDIASRWAVLQGLMDTDGTVDKKTGQPIFYTTSQKLAEQVVWLVESLGGLATTSIKETTHRPCWSIWIKFNDPSQCFRLPRKKVRCRLRTKYPVRRFIDRVEYVRDTECQCILVDHPDHLYLTNGCVVTHNTSLACGVAAKLLRVGKISKIVLARPLVQCDEELGILPGTMDEKMTPYLAPLTEALKEHVGTSFAALCGAEVIEVCPLAVMRGKTFHNAMVILDEAQNATPGQLRMFLTRMGYNSHMVVNGDVSQADINHAGKLPLVDAVDRLYGNDEIAIVRMTRADVLRPELVQWIDEQLTADADPGPPPSYGKRPNKSA